MAKFRIHYVRIEHHVYLLEVDAKNQQEAEEKADVMFAEGDYDPDSYNIVHAEEFINQVDKMEVEHG